MLHVLHHLLLRRFFAFEFIRHDDAWHEALFFQQFALIIALPPSDPDAVAAKLPAHSPPHPRLATNSIAVS